MKEELTLAIFLFVDFVGKMCVFVSRPTEIVTFLRKNGDLAKRVVHFLWERDTFLNKIMEIVEEFYEKCYNNNGKTWKSSKILRVKPNFFIFHCSSFFVIFSFFIFSFFHFFISFIFFIFFIFSFSSFSSFFYIFLHVSLIFFHYLSCSFIFFLISYNFFFFFFLFVFLYYFFFFLSGAQNLSLFGRQFRDGFFSHF